MACERQVRRQKADRADDTLTFYRENFDTGPDDDATIITDLVADLIHFCHIYNHNFGSLYAGALATAEGDLEEADR